MRSALRNHRWARLLSIIMIAVITVGALAACDGTDKGTDSNRQAAIASRENNFERAEAMWPAPTDLHNFPIRRALVEFTRRQDLVNHPWYTYVMTMGGGYLGYFVTETYPINSCNFLSSSERVLDRDDGADFVVTAPSYDGIFYGGGGSSAGCNSMFFFDLETNAMITFGGPIAWFTADAPLLLPDVQQLQTQPIPENTPPQPTAAPVTPTTEPVNE